MTDLVDLVAAMPGAPGPRRILVLGDPAARVCGALAAAGHRVTCCPDRQQAVGARHVDVAYETVADLIDDSAATFDVAIAVEGWRRLRWTNGATTTATLVEWLRAHVETLAVEAPRRILAPDLNDLGPFEVLPMLGDYAFLAEVTGHGAGDGRSTPIVLASDRALLAGGTWFAAQDVRRLGADAPDAATTPVRTYAVPGPLIVKVECTSEDYFERAQVAGEAAYLSTADADTRQRLDLPLVRAFVRGRAVATLVRDEVPAGPPPASIGAQMAGVLDAAAAHAELGLFHNDVRPWNVVWLGEIARLIDYADVSTADDDVRDLPQVLALAGTLAAIATEEIRGGQDFHGDVLDLAEEAGLLDAWPLSEQLTGPWLRLPRRRSDVRVHGGMSATQIIRTVLEVTCA